MSGDGHDKTTFHIGLAMAGAVSAGAYSAGVFDFLIEALNEWQKAKERGEDVPKHDVFISVISGTSAGGIVGALGLAALAGGVRSIEQKSVNPNQHWPVKYVLPELYDAWVKKTKLFDGREAAKKGGGNGSLLDTADLLQSNGLPASFLNSDALTRIARDSLRAIRPTGERHAFFSNPTHLFLTRTNLDGVPYPIMFEGNAFWMNLHEDRAHFAVTDLGKRDFPEHECQWLKKWEDAGQRIDFKDLAEHQGEPGGPLGGSFESYAQAALTTSAFPFGFQAREIAIQAADIRRRALPFDAGAFPDALKQLQAETGAQSAHTNFVCIDGGALNNEPFELARWTIRNLDEKQNSRDPKTANRAIILIAPFPPESPPKPSTKDSDKGPKSRKDDLALLFVARRLIPALIDQARFKSSDLIAAADPNVYSRYLISPSRQKRASPNEKVEPALACGLLYAFGGFLDEQFREHDFQLGRRNCQKFLTDHFVLHPDNPVFGQPGNAPSAPDAQRPIIPLVGTAAVEVERAPWPAISEQRLADLRTALAGRLDPLVGRFVSHVFGTSSILRIAARLSWRHQRSALVTRLMEGVEKALDDSQQIERTPRQGFLTRLKRWLGLGPHSIAPSREDLMRQLPREST